MAGLPTQRRLSREDFPAAPSWFDIAMGVLNGFMNDVYLALNGTLTFGTNIAGMIKSFRVTAGATAADNTFTFTHTLKKKPEGVIPISVTAVTDNYSPVTSAVTLSWRMNDTGQIVIDAITGLTAGTIYDLKVLVV